MAADKIRRGHHRRRHHGRRHRDHLRRRRLERARDEPVGENARRAAGAHGGRIEQARRRREAAPPTSRPTPTSKRLPWQDVDLVIEAATEDLALKQKLFSPTRDAGAARRFRLRATLRRSRSARSAGISKPARAWPDCTISCRRTWCRWSRSSRPNSPTSAVADWLEQNQKELGKAPVRVNKDIPGFIGNRLQHAMMREALYLVADGVVTPEGVDTAVRYGFGFRFLACGPMLQKEMSGWDTNFYAGSSVYPHLYSEKDAAAVPQGHGRQRPHRHEDAGAGCGSGPTRASPRKKRASRRFCRRRSRFSRPMRSRGKVQGSRFKGQGARG